MCNLIIFPPFPAKNVYGAHSMQSTMSTPTTRFDKDFQTPDVLLPASFQIENGGVHFYSICGGCSRMFLGEGNGVFHVKISENGAIPPKPSALAMCDNDLWSKCSAIWEIDDFFLEFGIALVQVFFYFFIALPSSFLFTTSPPSMLLAHLF